MLDLHMIYIEYERGKQKGEFYKKQFVYPIQSYFHVVLCLLCTY